MSARSPYDGLPASAFWRSGVAEAQPTDLRDIYDKKFDISPSDRIATAGSCFAQHISRHLRANGYNVLDVEPSPAWLKSESRLKYGYGMYSARYGNIYTVSQLLQLAREALGLIEPQSGCWMRGGRYYDAMRPAVEPDGLDSEDEVRFHRRYHLERVRELFRTMDLFIFTLGLTETWVHKASGTVYPTAPGVYAGEFDDDAFSFRNGRFADILADFHAFQDLLPAFRDERPLPRILLTVSPVPLTATASGRHVLQATTYSKATLRAVADELASHNHHIDYFPSYEIVTNQGSRGNFFEPNLRSVRPEGVATVMKIFFSVHKSADASEGAEAPPVALQPAKSDRGPGESAPSQSLEEVQCEEAVLEAFGR